MPLLQSLGSTPATGPTAAIQYASPTTAGSLSLIGVRMGSGGSITSVVDDRNAGAYTLVGPFDNGGGRDYIAYHESISGGVQPIITVNFSTSIAPRLNIAEFSNVIPAASLDQSNGTLGTSTAPASPSVTTTHGAELAVGFVSAAADVTFSQSGPWLIAPGTTARSCVVYQEVATIGALIAAVGINSSQAWIAQIATFQQTSVGIAALSASSVLVPVAIPRAFLSATATIANGITSQATASASTSITAISVSTNAHGRVGTRGQNVGVKAASSLSRGSIGAEQTITGSGGPLQVARPVLDDGVGAWTTNLGATNGLFSTLNETVPDDTNFIQSQPFPFSSQCSERLSALFVPNAGAQTLHYRFSKDIAGGQINLLVELMQGTTVVQAFTHTNISSAWVEADQIITNPITTWTIPFDVRFTATQTA